MKSKSKKIILDTNIWINFLITKNYSLLDEILFSHQCSLIFSEELLNEFMEVIRRPKFRRFFNQKDTEILIETIEEYALFIDVKSEVNICRDKKDNFLLALAKDAKADFLITGDKDLLELYQIDYTQILTINNFLESFK